MKSLFLDRDGVINERIPDSYVRNWSEFNFRPQVPEVIALLGKRFDHIFIVTNQQGIGKGLMNQQMLEELHQHMIGEIEQAGGRIDAIYHCPELTPTGPFCRKPLPGLAIQAQRDFPTIDFRNALMVGDMPSDIRFGKHLGMQTVQVVEKENLHSVLSFNRADHYIDDLQQLEKLLATNQIKFK